MTTERLDATDRVNLLISFVPYLIEHSPLSVSDIAAQFDVTEDSVKELIRLLAVSGVPGDSGMYLHQDLFDIDWDAFDERDEVVLWNHVAISTHPRLSRMEAAALVTGLQYVAGLADKRIELDVRALINKLTSSATSSAHVISIESSSVPSEVSRLNEALSAHRVVQFFYESGSGSSVRTVDPIRLDLVGQHWYLRAWCLDRQALRTFRISRMSDVLVTERNTTTSITPEGLPDELFDVADGQISVFCEIPSGSLGSISAYQPTVISTSDGGIATVEISLGNLEGVIALYARSRAQLRVIQPEQARDFLRNWAQIALDYQSQDA